MLIPWRRDREQAAAAQERANDALLEATHRAGKVDATVGSLRHRVFSQNHIVKDIETMIRSRR